MASRCGAGGVVGGVLFFLMQFHRSPVMGRIFLIPINKTVHDLLIL